MKGRTNTPARRDRLIREHVHDPYHSRSKLPDPCVCSGCGALYREGRWQWIPTCPDDATPEVCPSCRRIRDRLPAGTLELSGSFLRGREVELLQLIRHEETQERKEHPLHRIMEIDKRENDVIKISTTDIHLPKRFGRALERAYQGELKMDYPKETHFIRVTWRRE